MFDVCDKVFYVKPIKDTDDAEDIRVHPGTIRGVYIDTRLADGAVRDFVSYTFYEEGPKSVEISEKYVFASKPYALQFLKRYLADEIKATDIRLCALKNRYEDITNMINQG